MRLVAVIEIAYLKEVFNLLLRQVGPHRLLPLRLLPVRRQGVEAALVVVPVTEDDVGAFLDRLDLAGERVAFLWMTVSFSFLFFFGLHISLLTWLFSSAQRYRSLVVTEISCSIINTAR